MNSVLLDMKECGDATILIIDLQCIELNCFARDPEIFYRNNQFKIAEANYEFRVKLINFNSFVPK